MHIDPGYIRVLSPTNSNNNSQPKEGEILNASVQDLTSKQVVQELTATFSEFENNKDGEDTNAGNAAQGLSATDADKVSLSEEAKEKQAEEAAASGAQGGGSPSDIVIAKLKERIEQVKNN